MPAPDPLALRGKTFTTAALGRVESRSAHQHDPTDDARALANALADFNDEPTDERVFRTGRELGFTPERTLAAIKCAMRTGLIEAWKE